MHEHSALVQQRILSRYAEQLLAARRCLLLCIRHRTRLRLSSDTYIVGQVLNHINSVCIGIMGKVL